MNNMNKKQVKTKAANKMPSSLLAVVQVVRGFEWCENCSPPLHISTISLTQRINPRRKHTQREGLKSVIQNENINCDISKDYSSLAESSNTSSRNSKSCNVNCNDVTKCFGMTKADATKIFGLSSENTFTKVHCRYGIDVWPCVRKGVVKLSAHNALERGSGVYLTSSDETRQIEHINSLVMQDNDDINFKDDVVDKRMKELISDGRSLKPLIFV
ncbi:hypothetical protein E3N88_30847 [Mikania micrantha]|uniref:RWP-RK domain-containing protein n=1 Tax=Mikania micrantha TaxID=192012 RepID=A0A5N6MN89_9ASTR|nr:hypothetical protein E3N88_30847 [Mikania micrantha]